MFYLTIPARLAQFREAEVPCMNWYAASTMHARCAGALLGLIMGCQNSPARCCWPAHQRRLQRTVRSEILLLYLWSPQAVDSALRPDDAYVMLSPWITPVEAAATGRRRRLSQPLRGRQWQSLKVPYVYANDSLCAVTMTLHRRVHFLSTDQRRA